MAKLVDLTWDREIHLGLNFNEEPMEGNDMDDRPTPTVEVPQTHQYAQLLPNRSILHNFQL